ncbi:hypothetical protein E2C01_101494 [Portunus trituberculatus]|uniref:Uncharacterized protein n=1 Tax=Portunus trituberculatus TaxID=210409 RepID=A0A5B7KFW7_PORTR|nr:hypothetical protein [Portunus trituberculatus]
MSYVACVTALDLFLDEIKGYGVYVPRLFSVFDKSLTAHASPSGHQGWGGFWPHTAPPETTFLWSVGKDHLAG